MRRVDSPHHDNIHTHPRTRPRFLLSHLLSRPAPPPGISLATTLLALAQGAAAVGAYKTARFAYGKLQVRYSTVCVLAVCCDKGAPLVSAAWNPDPI
jgi:hypothetical protein